MPPGQRNDLPALLYERVLASIIPRLRGYLALRFLRRIYRGFQFGEGARCWGKPLVLMGKGSTITIGDRLWAVSDLRRGGISLYSPCKLRAMAGAQIIIGDDVGLNGTSICCQERIEIGSGTLIAANVVIVDSDFHVQWPPTARATCIDEARPVMIGTNVWIGMGSIVLKGAHIGDNSIVGAGSVVVGAIPANVVAAGNPARVLRQLGPEN